MPFQAFVLHMQGPRSKFLSGGAKDERVSQIGVGGGECIKILIPLNYGKLNFYFQMFTAVAFGSLNSL